MGNNGSDPLMANDVLENAILHALETYSNVHRGSGHKSISSTALFERCRTLVLEHCGLSPSKYRVLFCSPRQAELLKQLLKKGSYRILSSLDTGLSIGVRAVVVRKGALPRGKPPDSGGGTTRLISPDWVIWADAPARFEAGTPPLVNIVAFTRALQLQDGHRPGESGILQAAKADVDEILYGGSADSRSGPGLLEELRKTRIGAGLKVPTIAGQQEFIHLDNSASTSTFRPVYEAFRKVMVAGGTEPGRLLEEVRKICARFLGAPREEYGIWFTSNTTEAINMVADGRTREDISAGDEVVVTTMLEHSSNDLPWRRNTGQSLERLPVSEEGIIDTDELTRLLKEYNVDHSFGSKRIGLVTVSAASNVIGTCADLEEIAGIVHRFGARILVDGAQVIAHRRVSLADTGIDYFVFSAHKVYAPFGCGVLVSRKGYFGSPPEENPGLAAGEENLAGIAALGRILSLLERIGMDRVDRRERELTRLALEGMRKIPGIRIFGINGTDDPSLSRRVGVIAFNLKKTVSFRVGRELALHNAIGIRVGCHCAHILVKHILGVGPGLERFQRIMQILIPGIRFPGVARVSFGLENTESDVQEFIRGLKRIQEGREGHTEKGKNHPREMLKHYAAERTHLVFGS